MDINDYDKSIMFIKTLTKKSEDEIKKISSNKFNSLCNSILMSFNSLANTINNNKIKTKIKINNKWYYINCDISKLDAGRYVEVATFGADLINNLHKIMATIAVPMKWTLKGLKRIEYDASKHEDISNDMLNADFINSYSACILLIDSLKKLNSKFEALFGNSEDQENEKEIVTDNFQKHFGWIYNAKIVSEFENISLDNVWKLPVIQFLNDLTYLKLKLEWDDNKLKQSTKQSFK